MYKGLQMFFRHLSTALLLKIQHYLIMNFLNFYILFFHYESLNLRSRKVHHHPRCLVHVCARDEEMAQ